MTEGSWDPKIANQKVRLIATPGKQGLTTGKTRTDGGRLLVEVNFGPNEINLKKYNQLELVPEEETSIKFGSIADLRRILIFEKIKGQLTNVLYSMESSNTDFYPHQFKPVLKFLDSPVGRLLIADEVGLGKTIESIFIWKELQTRNQARRLLIVCPAVLREKWQQDLSTKFSIESEIINPKSLLTKLGQLLNSKDKHNFSFALIISLEGLRIPKNWDDENRNDSRSQIARILDNHPATENFSLFDLVIFDEAHYLRNPESNSNKTASLVRDAASHLVLLTATPIQISSQNLYNILKIISPEDFKYSTVFDNMLTANRPILGALRSLCSSAENIDILNTLDFIKSAKQSSYFESNQRLQLIEDEIEAICERGCEVPLNKLISWRRTLESCSLLEQFMTRSKKRDVLKNRVVRVAHPLPITFSDLERQIYNHISTQIRKLAKGQRGVALFSLVIRQRQMASSMVAALKVWQEQDILKNFLEADDFTLQLWEDFGLIDESLTQPNVWPFSNLDINEEDIQKLKACDSKYLNLIKFLKEALSRNPKEKFVLFAYFKGTLNYLKERLDKEGIKNCLLHGSIEASKDDVLSYFRDSDASILLSSEVGSEGVDLQFCRFLINYDLPWNPMKVEQRIGRIDRLGQKSQRISIVHYQITDTVEERILNRLYDRINVFKESIGDLEEILGEETENLLESLLSSELSEQERERQAQQTLMAIETKRRDQKDLEDKAMNLMAFSEYILDQITESRENGQWLRPTDLDYFIDDFFKLYYPETCITHLLNSKRKISLSDQAKVDLRIFCENYSSATSTQLTIRDTECLFDPRNLPDLQKSGVELINITHPLIQWIRSVYENKAKDENKFHPFFMSSAIVLPCSQSPLSQGIYIYIVQRWELQGLRKDVKLSFEAVSLEEYSFLPYDQVERALDVAIQVGQTLPNAENNFPLDQVQMAFQICKDKLDVDFFDFEESFEKENSDRCNIQEANINQYTIRKKMELEDRISRLELEGVSSKQQQIIPALRGQLHKLNQDLKVNLEKVRLRRSIQTRNITLASGLLLVE